MGKPFPVLPLFCFSITSLGQTIRLGTKWELISDFPNYLEWNYLKQPSETLCNHLTETARQMSFDSAMQ